MEHKYKFLRLEVKKKTSSTVTTTNINGQSSVMFAHCGEKKEAKDKDAVVLN